MVMQIFCPQTPISDAHSLTGWGQKVKIQLFQNMVMLHTKLNGIMKCSNMVANSLLSDPPPPPHDPRGWCQNPTFSEHGHVAYQIKGNHECSSQWYEVGDI